MHMVDALLSPAVGGTLWAATAGAIAWSSRRLRREGDDRKVPLLAVLGAFVFTAQMIKIAIPATGSCGHLGGALLLAILLGPHAAFLGIASVLVVQALFFADGGLLALGCNVVNLGALTAFVAYPLVYRPLARMGLHVTATIAAAVVGMQLAAFGVVVETSLSGISALPFGTFLLLMQPIHLAIGLLEGLLTVAIIAFVCRARPEIRAQVMAVRPAEDPPPRGLVPVFLVAALLTGGVLSNFVSEHPDGLEWAISRVAAGAELATPADGLHPLLSGLQERLTLFPGEPVGSTTPGEMPSPAPGTVGLVGGTVTLVLCLLFGRLLRRRSPRV
jgi:cobalt/nickel transport system permease protein